jgi:vacuolar-type H+-ATPase catalytic subunit A/Vma1
LETQNKKNKVLIIAGDISAYYDTLQETLNYLKEKFENVFFTFGNNELRIKKKEKYKSSFEKLEKMLEICDELGIITEPKKINNIWIVPIFVFLKQLKKGLVLS